MEDYKRKTIRIFGLVLVACFVATPALAQMTKESWSFNPQNRASIAALIKQIEDGDNGNAQSQVVGNGGTTLVCGGGSSDSNSSAMGNSSCIILNNSTGNIELGQDSTGDQTSNAESVSSSDLVTTDDILATLTASD